MRLCVLPCCCFFCGEKPSRTWVRARSQLEHPGQARRWNWWAAVMQHEGYWGVPCSGVCRAGVPSCPPFPGSSGSCSCCHLRCPGLAAGAEPGTTSSLFREGLGPRLPGMWWRSVFLSSRLSCGCGESQACHGASTSSPLFWAGPGSIAPPAHCCHTVNSRAGLSDWPGWPLSQQG